MKFYNEKLNTLDGETLAVLKEKVASFAPSFHDDPAILSAWGHRYFCETDGGRLIYDREKPTTHRCQCCGRVYDDEILNMTWQTFYRNDAIVTALVAAVVYRATGEDTYRQAAEKIIGFYAEHYLEFAIHNKNNDTYADYEEMAWGCGRIMPQGLNEAIVAIRIAQALEVLDEDVSESLRRSVKAMFQEIFKLLRPQATSIHNISCWLLAAIGVMGLHLGDERMVNFAFTSEYGIRRQLKEGVTQDGFWYEGSIHYNFFLLEGVSFLALFAHKYGYDFGRESLNTLSWMLERAYAYAFDGGSFPTPNDGWPDINLKTYLHVYHTFARVFGENSSVGELVKNIEASDIPRVTLPMSEPYYIGEMPLEKLMFNLDFDNGSFTPLERHSYNFPLSNFAMVREGKVNAFLKYGLNGKSHAHPDIMNVEIAYDGHRVSRDLSNAGYSSVLCRQWHRKSLSHNTVVWNGQDITSVSPGESLVFTDNTISARAAEVYEGITYSRTVSVQEGVLTDNFHVQSQREGTFDYVLHLEKDVLVGKPDHTVPAELGFQENGYQYASKVLRCETDAGELTLTAQGKNVKLDITIRLDEGKELFLCKTPDNPIGAERTTLIVRSHKQEDIFHTTIHFQDL